jgi:hypothetical protein
LQFAPSFDADYDQKFCRSAKLHTNFGLTFALAAAQVDWAGGGRRRQLNETSFFSIVNFISLDRFLIIQENHLSQF